MEQHIHILDLNFMDTSSSIASFLIESKDGLILIETGPETTFEYLKVAIARAGFDWRAVKHVLLTHIHFDHAGAAWKLAGNGATIYVHPIGLPHLQRPGKLWHSAKRIYKEQMEELWGKMEAIDMNFLVPARDGDMLRLGEIEIKVHYTPGHAIHHNAYQLRDVIFTGDVAGVAINKGPVVPPCPPPDIDLKIWKESIRKLQRLHPQKLYLTHFGEVVHPEQHLSELETILDDWANWMKPYFDAGHSSAEITPKFTAYTINQLKQQGVSKENINRYERANPSWMSVNGLLRYWKLKEQGRL